MPLPFSSSAIAFRVVAFGVFTAKGNSLSAAMRTSSRRIASETDKTKRLALVGEIQAYLLDQAYVIPIFEEPQAFAGSPKVKDFAFEAVGRPTFYNVWIAPK